MANKERINLMRKTVDKIRKEYEEGTSQADLSRLYGVHKNTIWNIVNNKSWVK